MLFHGHPDEGNQPLIEFNGNHLFRMITEVAGQAGCARTDFQDAVILTDTGCDDQLLEQVVIIDKVLSQPLLIAELAFPDSLFSFAHET